MSVSLPEFGVPLVVSGVLLGVLVIVVLFWMRRDKQQAPKVKSGARPKDSSRGARAPIDAELSPVQLTVDVGSTQASDWIKSGSLALGELQHGKFVVGPGQGGRTAASLVATPGRSYRLSFVVVAISEASNGGRSNFFAGPLFFDADGNIVGWWREQSPISLREGSRTGFVDSVAPENAAIVCAGVHGAHVREGVAGDSVVAFSHLKLELLSDVAP